MNPLNQKQPASLESIGASVTLLRLYASELQELKRRTSNLKFIDAYCSTFKSSPRDKEECKIEFLNSEGVPEVFVTKMMPLGSKECFFTLARSVLDRILIDENKDQWFSFTIHSNDNWVIVQVRETMVFCGPKLVS